MRPPTGSNNHHRRERAGRSPRSGQAAGQQDWLKDPHSIWYHRTSGIWQTVWLETVASTYVDCLRWTPNLERWEIGFEAWLGGRSGGGASAAGQDEGGRLPTRR